METEFNHDESNQGGNVPSTETPGAGDESKRMTSHDVERILKDRLARERAKYADYEDLKLKAVRLDEIEESNKSELQRVADRLSAVERERDEASARALRLSVAAEHGISRDDADLFLTGTDETTLQKQAKRLIDRDADRKMNGNRVPREGANPSVAETDERHVARALFGGTS